MIMIGVKRSSFPFYYIDANTIIFLVRDDPPQLGWGDLQLVRTLKNLRSTTTRRPTVDMVNQ